MPQTTFNVGQELRISGKAEDNRMRGVRVRVVRAYGINGENHGIEHVVAKWKPEPDTEPSYEVELLETRQPYWTGTLIWAKAHELEPVTG